MRRFQEITSILTQAVGALASEKIVGYLAEAEWDDAKQAERKLALLKVHDELCCSVETPPDPIETYDPRERYTDLWLTHDGRYITVGPLCRWSELGNIEITHCWLWTMTLEHGRQLRHEFTWYDHKTGRIDWYFGQEHYDRLQALNAAEETQAQTH